MRRLFVVCAMLLGCGKEPRPEPPPPSRAPVASESPPPAPPPPVRAAIPVEPPPPLEPARPEPPEKPEKPEPKKKEPRKREAPARSESTLQRDIFVRNAPGKDKGEVMLALRAGTKVKRLAHKGQWVQISFFDPKEKTTKTGWIWQEAFANQDSRQH
jgi:hypothetical protein